MKKVLMLASVASMINQFNMPNIHLLQEMGCEVHVACNFKEGSTCSDEKVLEIKRDSAKTIGIRFPLASVLLSSEENLFVSGS